MTAQRTTPLRRARVALDTNVIVSALIFRTGATARLRQVWQSGACVPLVSTPTARELVRVLAYPKFRLAAHEQDELLADYLPHAEVIRIAEPPPPVPLCRDPFDLPFLHLATTGKADFLITGDRDLLALTGQTAFAILTADAFVKSLMESDKI